MTHPLDIANKAFADYARAHAPKFRIPDDAHAEGPSPVVTFNGPDGEVELIGEVEIRAVLSSIERQLGFMARKAAREAEAA